MNSSANSGNKWVTCVSVYKIPRRTHLTRLLLRSIFRGLFHLLSRVTITGREHIPKNCAYLIAINHISLYEPPLVLAFWPDIPEAVGAVDIWNRRGQAMLARLYGGIRVHRGQFDRRLLDTMASVLESGLPLLIAPEGGRSHQPGMRRGLPGVAYIVDRVRVPVLPVGIVGTTTDFMKRALRGHSPNLEMRIGKPIHLPPVEGRGATRREQLQNNVDLIMAHIGALLPFEYRGYYANQVAALFDL